MSISIPSELQKYVVLTQSGELIDRFRCPVPGCDFTTRLGPGALRMHLILKADPSVPSRYDKSHEDYLRHNVVLDKEQVKALGNYPRRDIST